ncbi:hypothetical protein ES708_32686 [subsurface metagenome]
MVRFFQGFPDVAVPELPFQLGGQADLEPHDGVFDIVMLLSDSVKHGSCRLDIIGLNLNADGDEAAPLQRVKIEGDLSLAFFAIHLNLHQIKPFSVIRLAEIQPFQAAGIDHGRVFVQDLVLVNMSQGDIVEGGMSNVAHHQGVLLPDGH